MDMSVDHVKRLAYGIFSPVPAHEIASDIRFLKRTAPSYASNPGLHAMSKVRHKRLGGTPVLVWRGVRAQRQRSARAVSRANSEKKVKFVFGGPAHGCDRQIRFRGWALGGAAQSMDDPNGPALSRPGAALSARQ